MITVAPGPGLTRVQDPRNPNLYITSAGVSVSENDLEIQRLIASGDLVIVGGTGGGETGGSGPAWSGALLGRPSKTIAAAAYTLQGADILQALIFTNAAGCTVTVPAGMSAGFQVLLIQGGAGIVTLGAAAGVTLNPTGTTLGTNEAWAAVALMMVGNDAYAAFSWLPANQGRVDFAN